MRFSTFFKTIIPIAFIWGFLVVSVQAVATVSTTFNYVATTGDYIVRDIHTFGNSTVGGEHYNHYLNRTIWGSTSVLGPTSCSVSFYSSQNTTNNPECGGDGASGWGTSTNIQRIVTNEVWNLTSFEIFRLMLPQDVNLDQIIVPHTDYHANFIYNDYYNLVNVTGATRLVTFIVNSTSYPVNQQHTAESYYKLQYESECVESGETYNVSVTVRYLYKINAVHIVETYYEDQNVTILNSSMPDFRSQERYNSTLKCTNIEVPDTKNDIPGFETPLLIGSILVTSYWVIKKKKISVRSK